MSANDVQTIIDFVVRSRDWYHLQFVPFLYSHGSQEEKARIYDLTKLPLEKELAEMKFLLLGNEQLLQKAYEYTQRKIQSLPPLDLTPEERAKRVNTIIDILVRHMKHYLPSILHQSKDEERIRILSILDQDLISQCANLKMMLLVNDSFFTLVENVLQRRS